MKRNKEQTKRLKIEQTVDAGKPDEILKVFSQYQIKK